MLLAAVMLGLTAGGVTVAEVSKSGVTITPDQLKWKPSPSVPGLENAPMVGNSAKEAYVYRVKLPANFKIEAHTHPEDRTYTIISGTWYIGWGKKFDATAMKALPAGSFYTEPANVPHFVATKSEPVVVQISGSGPTAVNFVDPAHAPKK
jgi:uncharacterized RmlC-like cupin family protein